MSAGHNPFTNPKQRLITYGLTAMACFSVFLSISRVIATGQFRFLFLNWNLLLAIVPWLCSRWLVTRNQLAGKPFWCVALLATWLMFFPNSPYILTDMVHLDKVRGGLFWYDLVLLLSFGWTGLMFGFVSLLDIKYLLSNFIPSKLSWGAITLFLFISGYGVYLGRFERLNSWDIVYNPFRLAHIILGDLFHPLRHTHVWGITLLLGMLLNMMFWSIKLLGNSQDGLAAK